MEYFSSAIGMMSLPKSSLSVDFNKSMSTSVLKM